MKKATGPEAFRKLVASPAKLRLFMLTKLPMAYMADLRVTGCSDERAIVSVPYKYLTKNPFDSIYFACLSMAAELSTGILCMMHVYQSVPAVSMLVVHLEADFIKKATGKITFVCTAGKLIQETVERAKAIGEAQTVTATSTGTDEAGEEVARFSFTWSFKAKSRKHI